MEFRLAYEKTEEVVIFWSTKSKSIWIRERRNIALIIIILSYFDSLIDKQKDEFIFIEDSIKVYKGYTRLLYLNRGRDLI